VQDIYRIGDTEVFEVGGGAMAPFDLPAVRAFIRIFAPKRGEIVVDADSLDLRPAKSKAPDPSRPKAPRRKTRKPPTPKATPVSGDAPATDDAPATGDPADVAPTDDDAGSPAET
jgi:hypothetical protein